MKNLIEVPEVRSRRIISSGRIASLSAEGAGAARVAAFSAADPVFANGALLVDEWDPIIFDRILREYPMWNWIAKEIAPGDFTNGFNQTALGAARSANKRSLAYTATSPTRVARTPQEIKAIVNDIEFGLYDRSVYSIQGRRFGDLTEKDVRDSYNSCMRLWSALFYTGDKGSNALEFDGIVKFLGTGADTVLAAASVVKAIQEKVVAMMNRSDVVARPTDLLVNARVRAIISQELRKDGANRIPTMQILGETVEYLDTAAGPLPIRIDPFNRPVVGTPVVYRTFIVTKDTITWEYIPPLGNEGAEPKTFDIAQTNTLQSQFKTVQFGAIDLMGATVTDHNFQLNVQDRTGVVSPTA